MQEKIWQVRNVKKHFVMGKGQILHADNDVTCHVNNGEILGLVSESGCGKSTSGRTILGLDDKTVGEVLYDGNDIHALNERESFDYYRRMQMIFQDPYASLNPRSTVKEVVSEPMEVHGIYKSKKEQLDRVYQLLEEVGLNREDRKSVV